jgi:hypothetical protein
MSTLSAGTAPKVLRVAGLLAEADVSFGKAPAASPVTFNDSSPTTEGTVSFVVASSTADSSSAPCFDRLGLEASTLLKKKEEVNVQKLAQEEIKKGIHNGLETFTSMVHHHRQKRQLICASERRPLISWGGWAGDHHQSSMCFSRK